MSNQLSSLDNLSINCIRFLSIDAVQAANSGHPGLPMGFAPAAYQLFTKHLTYSSKNPDWLNRDRFVLSAGHGSALLYSLLHLSGYDLSLDDLKAFRQSGAKTPGHPEYGHTAGVEMTTGPLGQGLSNAVGMAITEKYLAATFNKSDIELFDYKVYAIAGDGCLQEGITSEASSLAGHLKLDNLVVLYDDNNVTIDGRTDLSFTEDVKARYEAYGWFVAEIPGDGHDLKALDAAIEAASKAGKPALIKMQSIIGFGSPNKQDSSGVHGSPLGADEILATKKHLGWPHKESFVVPEEVKAVFAKSTQAGADAEAKWNTLFADYKAKYPAEAKQIEDAQAGKLPEGLEASYPTFDAPTATRVASGKFLNAIAPKLPMLMGGSADLSPSNNTKFEGAEAFSAENNAGRYIHYGVREHGMAGIMNGMSAKGLTRAYGATFMCFSDYMLPSIRVAALSGYAPIYVLTHDSIGLGEDGPTHQPVEHASYLRAMPNLKFFRPGDAHETVWAWNYALEATDHPVAMGLTRQNLPILGDLASAKGTMKGGYVVKAASSPDVLLIATGSEVSIAVEAAKTLEEAGKQVQVISLPCVELFESQSQDYQDSVIPPQVSKRVIVEAGIKRGWEGYMGPEGTFIGMEGFGASAPAGELFEQFGITAAAIVEAAKQANQRI